MSAEIAIANVAELGAPLGLYSHVARVRGAAETLYIAGMLPADREGRIVGEGDFDVQADQVFANIATALAAHGAGWPSVVQFTTYLVDARLVPAFMAWRKRAFPRFFPDGKYPPNTLLIIDRLVHEKFLVEVQTVAVR
jgi:enamine deaminase RidA (YjgF/YER057c/UK114 family)